MVHIQHSTDNKFYFTVTGRNGRVLVTSETYNTKISAKKGIAALRKVLMVWTGLIVDHTGKLKIVKAKPKR